MANAEVRPADALTIAKEAYIYGYPFVVTTGSNIGSSWMPKTPSSWRLGISFLISRVGWAVANVRALCTAC